MVRIFFTLFIFALITACHDAGQEATPIGKNSATAVPTASPIVTPSAVPAISPTVTTPPTISPPPLPTATPTPTAVPVIITGNPRAAVIGPPVVDGNAPCGVVDLLDFPLDPPHGKNARGGGDFGIWRGRYEKYHAGEDWRLASGQNLGEPVYAVGHGLVTYADPNGWGRDKGVVIVRHTFTNGDSILSFYGHLDPPSVLLRPGLCVTRGEQVGSIGKPRTSPHLHFEMRTHLPYQTGTGYWFEDPRSAGWLPPSQTIWHSRISSAPGVIWTQMASGGELNNIGISLEQTLISLDHDLIVGIDSLDGSYLWAFPQPEDTEAVHYDPDHHLLYSASQLGTIQAFSIPADQPEEISPLGPSQLQPVWSMDLDLVGIPALLPLPGGGVVVFVWDEMVAISPQGDLLWTQENVGRPFDWVLTGDELLVSSLENGGSLLSITAETAVPWEIPLSGKLSADDGQIALLALDGVYRLDPPKFSSKKLLDLPGRGIDKTGIIALNDGNILITHLDKNDRRLLFLDSQGLIKWQRSIANEITGETSFIELHGQAYLVAQETEGDSVDVSIYAVDPQQGNLTHIFSAGTRSPITNSVDLETLNNDQIMINIGGQSMAILNLKAAQGVEG